MVEALVAVGFESVLLFSLAIAGFVWIRHLIHASMFRLSTKVRKMHRRLNMALLLQVCLSTIEAKK